MSDEPVYLREKGVLISAEPKVDRLVDGLMLKKPHENAPSWVKAKGSINLEQFGKWVTEYEKENTNNDWVNFSIQEPYLQAKMSINLTEFKAWIAEFVKANPSKQWINFDIKEGKEGGLYAQLDTWEPSKQEEKPKPKEESLPSWMTS